MRCISIFLILILSPVFILKSGGQEVRTSSDVESKNLPKAALKSKYRLRIKESQGGRKEEMQNVAQEFTVKFRMNTYILRKNNLFRIDAGDFAEKKYAKQRLGYIKKTHKNAKVVKSDNDSICDFFIVEKKKPQPNKTITSYPDKIPENKIEIKTIEIKPNDQPKNLSIVWNDPKNPEVNSALKEDYLTDAEKQLFYYLNLVRMYPKLFADTYLSHLRNSEDSYEKSLYSDLHKLTPLSALKPNRKLYESAKCHAVESGESGYVGHNRVKCSKYFMGECCQYGLSDPLEIIISLLIDQGVSSLGHRKICLGSYHELGVSIQPHKSYRVNAVLDFY